MRLLTGTDITTFFNSGDDLLVLAADGAFAGADYDDFPAGATGDLRIEAYNPINTEDGDEVQILLERSTISDGDCFPDALDADGQLVASAADEMAHIINNDAGLHTLVAVAEARAASAAWQHETERLARNHARAVSNVVDHCGGNQSEAARRLGVDQSTVNKLVRKARAAEATA